jgi:hypothetical protein
VALAASGAARLAGSVSTDADEGVASDPTRAAATVELHWIPLGAGQHVVRLSGRAFEALSALVQRRGRRDLFHSALTVTVPEGRYVVEMAPVPDAHGERRGVVAEGPVGTRLAGRLRVFRYENRCWRDGVIPDAAAAVATVSERVGSDRAHRLLALVRRVPTPVWGRDELGTGEMWNSNSVVSWLLGHGGLGGDLDAAVVRPPPGGRAPGWDAGLEVAAREGARPAAAAPPAVSPAVPA